MRKGQRFARAFKRAVAVEYLQSGEERKVIALKYGLPSVQTVFCLARAIIFRACRANSISFIDTAKVRNFHCGSRMFPRKF